MGDSLERFNSRYELAEGKICKTEDRSVQIVQLMDIKECIQRKIRILRDPWETIKHTTLNMQC